MLRRRLRDPVLWADASQLAKTVLAAVVAWVLAVKVFHNAQPFLAPWAALLTVHATVMGSVRKGAEQVGASIIGVLVAFGAGQLLGVNALALGLVVLVGLLVGAIPGVRADPTTAAATALVVLTAGYSTDGGMLATRLLDTGIGIAVGLLVNLAVWPPLRDRGAAAQIDIIDDRIGSLLCDIAAMPDGEPAVEEWVERTRAIDDDIAEGWRVLGQARESGRLNPRAATRRRMRATDDFGAVLQRVQQAVSETRSLALTIGYAPRPWDPAFRDAWLDLLRRTGEAVSDADTAALTRLRADIDSVASTLDPSALADTFWPVAGALLVNLRNIVEALGAVAGAQPVAVPSPAALSRR